ncbi:MAG: cysteine synthase family protein [Bdellovibrionales bacterium]|nr:cysteine synthase family protein [Bdellovibrionales bacterium]
MMRQGVYKNIVECIGNTPIVQLQKIGSEQIHDFYVKLECMNPGSSIKDRLALQMIRDAVDQGRLQKGGTIIETTSGNTGMGLAMIAAVEGFACIFTMPDKVSDEKVRALEAFGAKVVLAPTAVEPDDPRSYYSVAKQLEKEIPNSCYMNQYFNPSNPRAHYLSTGPEIWKQMGEHVDALVAGIGTGGTLCGSIKFLKEKNPEIQSVAIDPVGSIFYEKFTTGKVTSKAKPYLVEGFGEDILPSTVDFDFIDHMYQVSDQECFDMTRRLAIQEGIFAGGSCGGAIHGALEYGKSLREKKNILILLPDSGSRYLSKIYNPQWMKENGFV